MILNAHVDVDVLCVGIVNHDHGYCVTIQHKFVGWISRDIEQKIKNQVRMECR